jgi:hypothetical protein
LAKQDRKVPQGKSITSHRLFPAIIALWFGALFGLSSLAIRPGLLESLVVSAHFDSIIPAAAPPLGITARILLGLVVAALGSLLGLAIGRGIVRTTSKTARKPDNAALTDDAVSLRPRDAHPDAPARWPISAHDEIGDTEFGETELPTEPVLAGRRRSLTIPEHDDSHDFSPLTGGAAQILDLADLTFCDPDEGTETLDNLTQPDLECASELAGQAECIEESELTAVAGSSPTHEPAALNLVSLVDRLAQSMERRRMRDAERASAAVARSEATETEIEVLTAPIDLSISHNTGQVDEHNAFANIPPKRMIRLPSLTPASGLAAEDENDEQDDEDKVDESEGYSSLLNLSRIAAPRQTLAQIAGEPAPPVEPAEPFEPAVIFPGQAARMAAAAAPKAPDESTDLIGTQPSPFPAKRGSFRRNRVPDQVEAPQSRDETEHALRNALNTLQRMSGAA